MSTKGTLRYWFGGCVHIYHDCLDDKVYAMLFDRWAVRLPRKLFMGA